MAGLLLALIIAAQAAPAAPLGDIGKALDTLAAEGPEQASDSAGILTIPDNPAAPGFVVPPPPTPDVFGTRASPGRIDGKAGAQWLRVRDEGIDPPGLETLIGPVRRLKPLQHLGFVQARVNHLIPYRPDADWWAKEDYWATATETIERNGGDCEDLAIVKLQALRALGFPLDSLYLSIGRDTARGDHALLLVRIENRFFVLDDRNDRPIAADQFHGFVPVLTFVGGIEFVHGTAR